MANLDQGGVQERRSGGAAIDDNPVLAGLRETEAAYREFRAASRQQASQLGDSRAELVKVQDQLAGAKAHGDQLTMELDSTRAQLEAERRRAERERERTEKLTELVKEITARSSRATSTT